MSKKGLSGLENFPSVSEMTAKEYAEFLNIREVEFWKKFTPEVINFVSSGEFSNLQTDNYIVDSIDGYYDELLAFSVAETIIPEPSQLSNLVKTARLRPQCNLRRLHSYTECFITKISFRCFDSTLNNSDGITAGQDASVLTELQASITGSFNDAYMQSRFRHGEVGGYLLNFFRPYITTPNKTIFASQSSTNYEDANGKRDNLGDRSVGLYLPYEYIPLHPISIGTLSKFSDDITVWAMAGQIIDDGGTKKIQRYPVTCQIELLGMK